MDDTGLKLSPETPLPLSTRDASWFVPLREDRPELLDMGEGSLEDAASSLADMWRINRFAGGLHALTQHLYPRLQAHAGTATIVDLGTGSADIPLTIARWAKSQKKAVKILALDVAARHLKIARSRVQSAPAIRLIQADAGDLPLACNSVDYLVSSLFLHHLTPEQVIALLRQAFACVRSGVIMTDLVRGWLPMLAFRLSQPAFARSYLTRHDGIASVRRAYTPDELRQMAEAAGLTNVRVYQHWLWRMTLVADK